MFVSKVKPKSYHKPNLTVDTWELSVKEGVIKEEFRGKVPIEDEKSLMSLGFMLSNRGLNIENIVHKQNRSIRTKKQILKMIEPLGPFAFESAFIYRVFNKKQ